MRRYWTEPGYTAWIPWVAGTVQTLLFANFFYYYVVARAKGERHFSLPT